jgi:hypothetical protein
MITAWYMRLIPGHHGAFDYVGGLPTHLPPTFPISEETGQPLRFLAQFACDGQRLSVANARFLQIYQDDPEYDPMPVIVLVREGACENAEGIGTSQPGVLLHDIEWEARVDPESRTTDDVHLAKSKAGGTCYFSDKIRPGERLLLQLREYPAEINFGGFTMVLAINDQQAIRVMLG